MAYPKVFDVPVEFSLELKTIVRSGFTNAEWELFNDMVDEAYCISLSVLLIDLQSWTRVASSMAVYWKRRTFSPYFQ